MSKPAALSAGTPSKPWSDPEADPLADMRKALAYWSSDEYAERVRQEEREAAIRFEALAKRLREMHK